ncbi:hypothetical protein [Alteromonas sp. 009811495]|uniref:hypothetical protein n=1 Tax=Alteromonas sp. 009811495 TaxID=3002962 RepID=UPI001921840B|nr:hypothetical protein [Alteromonas sp. 009811495]WDT86418.1 hypothetical protein OZ660_01315 [Alteromonas sp. 009811495]
MKMPIQLSNAIYYHVSRIGFVVLLFVALFLLLSAFKGHLPTGKQFRTSGISLHCLEKADPLSQRLKKNTTLKCLFGYV